MRSSDENSVCPSVCLSNAWIVIKRKKDLSSDSKRLICSDLRTSAVSFMSSTSFQFQLVLTAMDFWFRFRFCGFFPSSSPLCQHRSPDGPHVRLSSVGNRAFPVAAHCVWNNLPSEVTSAQSLHSFRLHLKTFLFQRSLPNVVLTL